MSPPAWIGVENYIELWEDSAFLEILSNTFIFSIIYTGGVMVFGLLLAVLVNKKFKGSNFFRTTFFTPVVTSAVAVGLIWNWILAPQFGIVNSTVEQAFALVPPNWLQDKTYVLYVVAWIQVWKMAGYYMMIYLAGLQGIPKTLYEAAHIDGASGSQSFWKITLPLLSPTTFFVFTIAIIDSFNNFELIYTITRGGPQNATNTLVYSVYLNAFEYFRMGYASAVAYVLLVIVSICIVINYWLKKRWVQYH